MSDQQYGKKLVEEEYVEHFLEAYKHATGQRLVIVGSGERPDFICRRPDGEEVGVELTEVRDKMGYYTCGLQDVVANKAAKRASGEWRLRDNTILVMIVTWEPLSDLKIARDVKETRIWKQGFREVWVADLSGVDAFGNAELFCLYPKKLWGFYRRPNWGSKPYG